MLRILISVILGAGLISVPAFAGTYDKQIHSAMDYLVATQTTGAEGYDPGQWKSQVTSTLPSFIGVGKDGIPFEEPSAFVAGSVANILAEMYFLKPFDARVPEVLHKTIGGFQPYEWGAVYHFYPPALYQGLPIRNPRHMFLKLRFQGFADTPPDNDTTAVSFLTQAYSEAIDRNEPLTRSDFRLGRDSLALMTEYRDENRVKPHTYNRIHGWVDTGAYLTWIWDETNPNSPRYWLAHPDQGTRIPFNVNDVDCIVNANMLKLLSVSHQTQAPGFESSCHYLNEVVAREGFFSCGMYYPSIYLLPYTLAVAHHGGLSCADESREHLLKYVIQKQRPDGWWANDPHARPDYVQSTAWAVNTVMMLGNPHDPDQRKRVQQALRNLLSQGLRDSAGRLYWKGEVFYAATFIARRPVVWRSDAYTTASVIRALQYADQVWGLK